MTENDVWNKMRAEGKINICFPVHYGKERAEYYTKELTEEEVEEIENDLIELNKIINEKVGRK